MRNRLRSVVLLLGLLGCGARSSLLDVDGSAAESALCGPLGEPEVLFADRGLPDYVAVGVDYLFWIEGEALHRTLWRAPKRGDGDPEQISSAQIFEGLLLMGDDLYTFRDGDLVRIPVRGGSESILLTNYFGGPKLVGDDGALYWLESGNMYATTSYVKKLSLGGGSPTTLAQWSHYVFDLALSGDSVLWVHQSDSLGQVAMGGIRRTPKSGGPSESLFSGINPAAVAAADDGVYWSAGRPGDHYPSAIWWRSHAGGEAIPVVAGGMWFAQIVPRRQCLYFVVVDSLAEGGPVRLGRTPLTGGAPSWLATTPRSYQHQARVAFDDSHIYWNDVIRGRILRLAYDGR